MKTCYGRSQYILGWYSICLKSSMIENENLPITTSFIHEVFSKEVVKSSPINDIDSAIHLDIVIDDISADCGIKYSALMASGRDGNILNFSAIPKCEVEYPKEETFVARSLLHSLKNSSNNSEAVPFPSAKEFNETALKEFSELYEKLKASPSLNEEASSLLNQFPDSCAYKKQAEKFKSDLKGMHELVKLLCDQMRESQKVFMSSDSN